MCERVGGERGVGGKGQRGSARTLSNTHTHGLTLLPSPPLPSNLAERRGRGERAASADRGRQAGRQWVGVGQIGQREGEGRTAGKPGDSETGDLWGRDKQCSPVVSACPCRGPHFRSSYLRAGVSPWHMAARSLGPELELEII